MEVKHMLLNWWCNIPHVYWILQYLVLLYSNKWKSSVCITVTCRLILIRVAKLWNFGKCSKLELKEIICKFWVIYKNYNHKHQLSHLHLCATNPLYSRVIFVDSFQYSQIFATLFLIDFKANVNVMTSLDCIIGPVSAFTSQPKV